MAQTVKNLPAVQENWVRSPGQKEHLEKEMTTHSSIFAEELGGSQSMGYQRVGHDWATNTNTRFVIAFLPRSKQLLISCLQSSSAVILEPKKRKPVTVSIVSPSIYNEVLDRIEHNYSSGMLSHIQLFTTSWTVVCQSSLSIGFSRQEYWRGLPFPSPGDLPDPGILRLYTLKTVSWFHGLQFQVY